MTQGRMPIYVTLGEEILGARELPRVKLETLMQKRLVGLGPVTMGQLGSDYILETLQSGKEHFQKQESAEHLVSRMAQLKLAGVRLQDRLADASSFQARLDHFLQYCVARSTNQNFPHREVKALCGKASMLSHEYYNHCGGCVPKGTGGRIQLAGVSESCTTGARRVIVP
jgi:hypothetical protein